MERCKLYKEYILVNSLTSLSCLHPIYFHSFAEKREQTQREAHAGDLLPKRQTEGLPMPATEEDGFDTTGVALI